MAATAWQPLPCLQKLTAHASPSLPSSSAVDLLGVDLDMAVSIQRGRIGLYPNQSEAAPSASKAAPAGRAAPGSRLPGGGKAQPAGRLGVAGKAQPAGRPLATRRPAAAAAQPAPTTTASATAIDGSNSNRSALPPAGQGLNKAALVTFRRMAVKDGSDVAAAEAFRAKLQEASARMGGVFVHYDPADGVWLVKLDAWQ